MDSDISVCKYIHFGIKNYIFQEQGIKKKQNSQQIHCNILLNLAVYCRRIKNTHISCFKNKKLACHEPHTERQD